MSATTTIPRFLLPRGDLCLRSTRHLILRNTVYNPRQLLPATSRHVSSSRTIPKPIPKSAPNILAKPEKFVPPSHPSRLVKPAPIRQYGPALTSEEKHVHETKQYPHSPPPRGSLMDRFLNNRMLHMTIALGVLVFFACWTLMLNFKATSPYAGQMPGLNAYLSNPIAAVQEFVRLFKLDILHDSEVAEKKRQRMLSETMKTKAYRVMHGLEPLQGQPTEVQILVAQMRGEYDDGKGTEEPAPIVEVEPEKKPVKKWLGIW